MPSPLLIIISGPPCSGKTALGDWLAQAFKLPLFHRDGFKEVLFDSLGWSDLEWSQRLGGASYALLYHAAEALLRAERSVIIESNFDPQYDTRRLRDLAARHPFLPLQIRCMAEGAVLFERFKQRVAGGTRHPGHLDHLNIPIYEPIVWEGPSARDNFLDIGGERIDIDTTDFAKVDYDAILALVHAAIARLQGFGSAGVV
jgi:predicted kinase